MRSTFRRRSTSLLLFALLAGGAASARGQTAEEACAVLDPPRLAECLLAVATARSVQERIGTALWGGSPVPGTASTLGMRIGSTPRFTASAGLGLVPATLPPLLDRAESGSTTGLVPALAARTAIGLLPGWSPLPTVGGVMSLDLIAGASLAVLPGNHGFREGTAAAWLAGARVGLLRESFTLPGVSVTGTYGRSTRVTLGDAVDRTTDGHFRGTLSDLNATLAISRRISALRLTGGAAVDRYTTRNAGLGFRGEEVIYDWEIRRLNSDRWSAFVNAAWTVLIFHGAVEAGWQQIPTPDGLPAGVTFDPARWWAGAAFRVSI